MNILAILYGGLMLINIAIWQDPGLFGDFGGAGRAITNPTIDGFIKPRPGNPRDPAVADLRDARRHAAAVARSTT